MGSKVQFTLNGELQSVEVEEAAGKTLNEYIRCQTPHTGTKVSCAQGGCGACTVAVARPNEALRSLPSCLTPLASVHGAAVVTVEGISDCGTKPHPIAERLAKFGGSQCGFCTPGMVMQLFATISQKDGGKACNESELEQCINGNICRCTGYRPIVECAKSFAADSKVVSQIDPTVPTGPYDGAADPALVFPAPAPLAAGCWLRPSGVAEVAKALKAGAVLVAGGTAAGIYPDLAVAARRAGGAVFADIGGVQELKDMKLQGSTLHVGATVTWTAFADQLRGLLDSGAAANAQAVEALRERCGSIAGAQVRNAGTIGGNIVITRNRGFLSDWVPPLAALGARVKGLDVAGRPFEEDLLAFVQAEAAFAGLVAAVLVPLPGPEVAFRCYRVAKRSRNAHALVNAGFAASVSGDKITQATFVLGAVDPKPVRLKNTERAMSGVRQEDILTSLPTILGTLSEKVNADLFPLFCNYGREQTAHIVTGFLVKFIAATFGAAVPKEWATAAYSLHDAERSTSAAQTFPPPEDLMGPLNKPMVKTSALEQCMGRAKFVDDVPRPTGTLLAAYVLCPEANVTVTGIDDATAKAMLGTDFHALVTAADLRTATVNSSNWMAMDALPPKFLDGYDTTSYLLLPAGKASRYGGEPVALLLARGDSPRLVEQAAAACSAALKFERNGPVDIGNLRTSPEATEQMRFSRGKMPASDAIEKARNAGGRQYVSGKFKKKSQAHFYMEGQSVLAVPDEGGLACYVACQGADIVQKAICGATGLTQANVAVKYRRVGGGFGGKCLFPGVMAALASQVALAQKLPVRLVLPRETDMALVGGRQEMEGDWEVAVDPATGKILAMHYDLWIAHGVGVNLQKFVPQAIAAALDECYALPSVTVTARFAKQDVVDRTAVRAPGHLEASMLMEAVMDGVSSSLAIPADTLREANLCRGRFNASGLAGGMLPVGHMDDNSNVAMWSLIKKKTGYEARAKAVEEFNRTSAWKKRGISITPARYGVFLPPGNAARVDIFKDGSVQVAVSGSEIGQGLHVKVGQMVSTVFARKLGAGPPMESIRFLDTSTEQNPNGAGTGGSTTSEGAMFAAADAVAQLAERLKGSVSAAKKLSAADKSQAGPWFDIIGETFNASFLFLKVPPNLSAVGMHYPVATEMMYETYGVGVSEVELDVLTGESRVLFTHLMFDSGMSYNPMVDIGQMEGAYMMGLGHIMYEGIDFDHATGKLLTDNTWTYKPPIACDVPEKFDVELVDMRSQRLNNPMVKTMMGAMGKMLGLAGIPWKVTKVDKAFKSAKAIGEPPILLCCAAHSALMGAMVAATGGPLPDKGLPIPAKPFDLLPLLHAQKPGSGTGRDDTSTASTVYSQLHEQAARQAGPAAPAGPARAADRRPKASIVRRAASFFCSCAR